jgi:hypothetical protein
MAPIRLSDVEEARFVRETARRGRATRPTSTTSSPPTSPCTSRPIVAALAAGDATAGRARISAHARRVRKETPALLRGPGDATRSPVRTPASSPGCPAPTHLGSDGPLWTFAGNPSAGTAGRRESHNGTVTLPFGVAIVVIGVRMMSTIRAA